jgi:hypothetical protein
LTFIGCRVVGLAVLVDDVTGIAGQCARKASCEDIAAVTLNTSDFLIIFQTVGDQQVCENTLGGINSKYLISIVALHTFKRVVAIKNLTVRVFLKAASIDQSIAPLAAGTYIGFRVYNKTCSTVDRVWNLIS